MFFDVQRLCFSYYKSPMTLKDVSFSFENGSKVLILASKDMGKATILKVISGFEDSRFGNIYLNGKELKQINDKEKCFSLVLSEPVLMERKTIKENLDFQCEISGKVKLSSEQVDALLKDFNISQNESAKVKKLSLFEKRKLQVARAMIKKPKILFLDDQFECLASDEKVEMKGIYDKLLTDKSLTIVYALGDETFKFLKSAKFEFVSNKTLYLNLANVLEFKNVKEFEKSYISLDMLKFLESVEMTPCYIEKDKENYFLCKGEERLFVFDKSFNKKLDELKLEFGDIEEVLVYLPSCESLKEIDSSKFNKKINEKSIFIYSNLTGNLVL